MNFSHRGMPIIALTIIIVLVIIGIGIMNLSINSTSNEETGLTVYTEPEVLVADDKSVYLQDDDGKVDSVYVQVLPPSGEYTTFEYINENPNFTTESYGTDDNDPRALVLVTIDGVTRRGTIELRGQSSRLADQKSYKIKFFEGELPYNGFMTLNLNKHYKDLTRVRNKLAFDLIEDIDSMIGLRTRFVRLYVSGAGEQTDYGLYTHIEQPNKTFLASHGLDKNGQLYKAEFFEFLRYSGDIESVDAVSYSEERFNEYLEVRENENNKKLVRLLEDVNDPKLNINEVVKKHFDLDNIVSWVAFNILLDNYDSNSRNYMLYSPSYSEKWYFVSWDLDKTLRDKDETYWTFGVSNYWGIELFQRLFRDPDNMLALINKVEELYEYFDETSLMRRISIYEKVIDSDLFASVDGIYYQEDIFDSRTRHPDINNISDYKSKLYELATIPSKNRQRFYENLERPYPYFIQAEELDGEYVFSWDLAFDMQGDMVNYTLYIYDDVVERNALFEITTNDLTVTLASIPENARYFTIIARDEKGFEQVPFNRISVDGRVYIGIERFDE